MFTQTVDQYQQGQIKENDFSTKYFKQVSLNFGR